MGYPLKLHLFQSPIPGIDCMHLKPFSAMLFAIGALSAVVQPVIAQTGSAPTEQVIPAGDTTYRGPFTVDPATGAVNGTGKVEWRNGNRYEGPVRNNQLTGKGKFTWSNGDRYEGDMVNAEPHGQGTYYFKGGDRYSGAWNNGRKHGQGRYTFEDGSYWEGQYANDRQVSGGMGYEKANAAEAPKAAVVSSSQPVQPAREALPVAPMEPKRESSQQAKAGGGDPNKYSTTPGNPSCRFFDGFADNGDGTVTDPRNGLVWKRCAEGFEWNGRSCTGAVNRGNWFDSMRIAKQSRFLGKSDWRIPTKTEFESVLGKYEDCKKNDDKAGQYAASLAIAHPVYSDGYPGSFWSSSPSAGDGEVAWFGGFYDGSMGYFSSRLTPKGVRLVRTNQSSGTKAALEFNTEYAKVITMEKAIAAEKAREVRAIKQKEIEAKRREAEEKRRISYENSPAGRAAAREAAAREDRQRAQRCSHLYAGKVVPIRTGIGSVDGVIQGVGHGVATVKYWLVLSKEWKYEEVACDELR